MFNKLIDNFLSKYINEDFLLQQKARIVTIISICMMLIIPSVVAIYTIMGRSNTAVTIPLGFLFAILVALQLLLKKGYYRIYAHMNLIAILILMWIIIFSDSGKPYINIINSLVFILALITMIPLITLRKMKAIPLYFGINATVLVAFLLKTKKDLGLSDFIINGLLADYLIALFIMSLIAYFTLRVNISAIEKMAEAEMEISAQNEELTAANEELEAMNEELTKSQTRLQESENKYRVLYDNALVGMATFRLSDGTLTNANSTAYRMLGYAQNDNIIEKLNLADLFPSSDEKNMVINELKSRRELFDYEIQQRKKDGSFIWSALSARINTDNDIIEGVFTDISKSKFAEEYIQKLTFFDSLTGLPNRKMLIEKLYTEIQKTYRHRQHNVFSLMSIGIDKLKNITDIHGPSVENKLIRKIAHRLQEVFRGDDVVARYDDNKFMILLSDIGNSEGVIEIVKKTFSIFEDPFEIESKSISITASCGVTIYPSDGESPELLIKNSLLSLDSAREKGRNSYQLFNAELNEKIISNIQLEEKLTLAINNDELITYFQPKYNYHGKIIGMESLVRWNSPEKGMVAPLVFIPLAERTGLIKKIGSIVLLKSCRHNKEWQNMGYPPLRVSVNISPPEMNHPDFVSNLERIIQQTGLDPKWLELEITETAIMSNEDEARKKLLAIHSMGISISIDDFGTGYSSLSKLKDLPIDTVKIDKSFVDNLPHDRKAVTIATAIIELAHNLDFTVVAEGIETREQLEFLNSLSCDQYQGYYFSKPVSPHDFEMKLKQELEGM
ncbi:MAG: hypothetical protein CVV44_13820 [Spirochaetae bacterium HGW-Spirochaetae-1]|jgi:diguanylate cyclase (GGDEF)-like protein/PAS domain S-box-containing protein|nr:MAG: hypothetical protein CVV44_13820 [Spirochaetae bacterium HGW-Spirochaetae-1]